MKKLIIALVVVFVIGFAIFTFMLLDEDDANSKKDLTLMNLDEVSLPLCTASPKVPDTDVTYYVAANEQGADNERCDGLAPTNEGNNHCPFKDFTSPRVREKLFLTPEGNYGTNSVTIKVRKGTYFIHPLKLFPDEPVQPLLINADGQTERESVILMSYDGEEAIIDGSCPSNLRTCDYPENPGKIWTILEIYGSHVIIQGLTFNNAYGRNIQIGSINTHIRCNKLIGSYGSDSDSIKAVSDEGPVYIYGNEFSGPYEQALDGTRARNWIIENNAVHDGTKGFGFKFGARNIIIRNNHFFDLKEKALDLGGDGSTSHVNEYEAYDIHADANTIERVEKAVEFAHCYNCTFNNNSVTRAKVGIHFGEEHPGHPDGCQNGRGCLPSTKAKISNNRFRDLRDPEGKFNNVFIVADPARILNLEASNNLYCVPDGEQPLFWRGGVVPQDLIRDLAVWQEKSNTDQNSQIAKTTDLKCKDW
ncbi:MAG: right-handed parallel beta-helix repeat-containing protein [Patescibacteria group bacterium]